MHKPLLIAAGLLLVSSAVLADMYQDAKNAELPAARQNLELGTVKSEGGDPPNADVVTNFYDDYGRVQFQVASNPEANQYAIEQAGVGPNGATRVCAPTTSDTNCNYVAGGKGMHFFAGGAGALAQIMYAGSGAPVTSWVRLLASDTKASVQGYASLAADADLDINAKGDGKTTISNTHGTIAQFTSPLLPIVEPLVFTASVGGSPAGINAAANGVVLSNSRIVARLALGTNPVPTGQSGSHYHNLGATGPTTFNLPSAAQGLSYCFTAKEAQQLIVKAAAGDKIAIAATNSTAGGQIAASAAFASVCIEAHEAGQWITISTPDKTQWVVT